MNAPLGLEGLLGGRILQAVNAELVEAQAASAAKNCKVTVTLKLSLSPADDDGFGTMSYQLDHKLKRAPSKTFTTEVNDDGIITHDGASPLDVRQEKLPFAGEEPARVISFERNASNG